MEAFFSWMKNIVGSLCILELLCHVVRNQEYEKYLRFFGGLVFLLLLLEPLLKLTGTEEIFRGAFQDAVLEVEAHLTQENVTALEALQNEQVEKAYLSELERQIETVVTLCGQIPYKEVITLDEREPGEIEQIEIWFESQEETAEQFVGETDQQAEGESAEQIKLQIISLYGLDAEQIQIFHMSGVSTESAHI